MTPSRLDDERLAELLTRYDFSEPADFTDAFLAIGELRERRAAESADTGHWVPWKLGDALPADGSYLIQSDSGTRYMFTVWGAVKDFPSYIIAYWSRPLPPPYAPSSPDGEKGR